jgi:hypothetical protein
MPVERNQRLESDQFCTNRGRLGASAWWRPDGGPSSELVVADRLSAETNAPSAGKNGLIDDAFTVMAFQQTSF